MTVRLRGRSLVWGLLTPPFSFDSVIDPPCPERQKLAAVTDDYAEIRHLVEQPAENEPQDVLSRFDVESPG